VQGIVYKQLCFISGIRFVLFLRIFYIYILVQSYVSVILQHIEANERNVIDCVLKGIGKEDATAKCDTNTALTL